MTIILMSLQAWPHFSTKRITVQSVKRGTNRKKNTNATMRATCAINYIKRRRRGTGGIVIHATDISKDVSVSIYTVCKMKKVIQHVRHTTDVNVAKQ